MHKDRRSFVKTATLAAATGFLPRHLFSGSPPIAKTIRVVVWDERQPRQKEAYENFLRNEIARYLEKQSGLSVQSVALDDPEQGLSDTILNNCDVLVWWGHQRQSEVLSETGRKIVDKILSGSIAFMPLHSAHWATPFVEAMNEITRRHAGQLVKSAQQEITYVAPPKQYTVPKYDTRITPYTIIRKFPKGKEKFEVHLPYCCFPAYRNDGKPSLVKVLKPGHPIANGIPAEFELPQTEMYDEPFHVPPPDEVILEERWATGEWFRSGMLWRLGKGRIFYFRPGHETFPVYKQELALKIINNAVRWLGKAV
ncbi:MAG: ThuA domain-containing protein [Cyclobacteriaceae bacterium]